MKLFIHSVSVDTTTTTIEENFRDTFGAEVLARRSSPIKAPSGKWICSVVIEVTESSRELNRFIEQIRIHRFNSFYANKTEYVVAIHNGSSSPTTAPVTRITPRIVF
jgi:hypothetical protein